MIDRYFLAVYLNDFLGCSFESNDMYLANHEGRGDPHHHISSNKDKPKNGMPQSPQGKHRRTTLQAKSRLKNEVFPIIGLQHDIADAQERVKILHATRTHIKIIPQLK